MVDVQLVEQTFRGTPSSSVKARKNSFFVRRETSALLTEHRPPFLSLSLIKTVSSCVVQIVCVITNQGSGNPNCFELSKGCV